MTDIDKAHVTNFVEVVVTAFIDCPVQVQHDLINTHRGTEDRWTVFAPEKHQGALIGSGGRTAGLLRRLLRLKVSTMGFTDPVDLLVHSSRPAGR